MMAGRVWPQGIVYGRVLNIWDQIPLCCGVLSRALDLFSSISPGLYSLNANRTLYIPLIAAAKPVLLTVLAESSLIENC